MGASTSRNLRFVTAREALQSSLIRDVWSRLATASSNPDAMYQSPEWLEHLSATEVDAEHRIAIVERGSEQIVGVVPIRFHNLRLNFGVSSLPLLRGGLPVANILGSQPMLPAEFDVHAALYGAIASHFPHCRGVYFRTMPKESTSWAFVQQFADSDWLCHTTDGPHRHHLIRIPKTMQEYLASIDSRARQNLKRCMKQFRSSGDGNAHIERIENRDQVGKFLENAARISRNSWQHEQIGVRIGKEPNQRAKMEYLADLGLLRSYILYYGDLPCAFSIGYQLGRSFHDTEAGYDQNLKHLSPGNVLFMRQIEDLMTHRVVDWYDFGVGDAAYKGRLSTDSYEATSVLLMSKTVANQAIVLAHRCSLAGRAQLRKSLWLRQARKLASK